MNLAFSAYLEVVITTPGDAMSKTTAPFELAGGDDLSSSKGSHTLKLGIDIGSTTVKAVLLAGRQVILSLIHI